MTRLMRLMRSIAADRQGATIVEFAIILLPLCVVLFGAIDLGYHSYVRSVLQGALDDVARTASVESPKFAASGDTIEQRIRAAIEQRVNTIARNATYEVDQRSYYEFSGVGGSEKLITDVNRNGEYDTGDCWQDLNGNGRFDVNAGKTGRGGADDVVFYQVTLVMPRLVPTPEFLGFDENYTISAQAAIRNQPYSRQQVPETVCG